MSFHDGSSGALPVEVLNRPGKCLFFLKRKHKYCTGTVDSAHGGDGRVYCSLHRLDAPSRVPCPIDPRHDVRADDVERHLHVCPSRCAGNASPYMELGVNLSRRLCRSAEPEGATLHAKELSLCDGLVFRAWLEGQYARVETQPWWRNPSKTSPSLTSDITFDALASHSGVLEQYVREGSQKHRLQQCLLADLLLSSLRQPTAALRSDVVEVGAGKGGVACVIAKVCPSARICVVERTTYRDPKEKELNKQRRRAAEAAGDLGTISSFSPIERAALDAQNFSLTKFALARPRLPEKAVAPQPVHGSVPSDTLTAAFRPTLGVIGKHLCGNCTDFAIRIATFPVHMPGKKRDRGSDGQGDDAVPTTDDSHNDLYPNRAVVLATCCHHLTDFAEYVGSDCTLLLGPSSQPSGKNPTSSSVALAEYDHLFPSARDFCLTRSICSWALIGASEALRSTEHPCVANAGDGQECAASDLHGSEASWASTVSVREKIELGRKAKTLIDAGRVWFLRERCRWAVVSYQPYADESVTGERFAIVSVQHDHSPPL